MHVHKIVVLGDGGVGKSYDPTIEDSYRKQMVIDETPCILEVLDTAGQEEYSALRDQWIRDGDGFLLVYSVTSKSSFERIQSFIIQIARVKGAKSTAIVLAGNKSDLPNEREVTFYEGETISRLMGCSFVETSAKRRVNVEEAFSEVARMVRKVQNIPTKQESKAISIINSIAPESKNTMCRCTIL
ncbi:hypothetical protein BB559_000331 [Furculomyces boomerangus]|uniref:Uncharacterized protein n=1 Tax=Furculomyces boomerangus TaxID=61424 RepID=A0A2T9Z400_9FUNG|nr:hypothetical protein BB559_000841 [Furculomyces boomerangus]PVU99884.1 hypothetical protein BB559_000331 [Furculomyces boomerangus]